eukprot:2389536-Amphidinium_carterae.1
MSLCAYSRYCACCSPTECKHQQARFSQQLCGRTLATPGKHGLMNGATPRKASQKPNSIHIATVCTSRELSPEPWD